MTSSDDPPDSLSSRARRTRRLRVKRGAPRWLGRPPRTAEVVVARAEPQTPPEPAPPPPRAFEDADERAPPRAFEDADERFFLAEDSLAPTELAVEGLVEEADAPLARIDSPRRRAFARYVGAVVVLAAGMCVAAFTSQAHRSAPAAAAPAVAAAPERTAPAPVPERTAPAPVPAAAPPPLALTAERPPEPVPTIDPRAARAAREQARAALERGDLPRAVGTGIESVELDPADAEAWLVLGAAELASGKSREARATFTACTKLATRGPRHECAQMLQ